MHLVREIIVSDDFKEMDFTLVQGASTKTIANGVITFESLNTIDRGYGVIPIGSIGGNGAIVEVICEARQEIDDSQGRFGLDQDSSPFQGGKNTEYIVPLTKDWKTYEMRFPVKPWNHYAMLTFGVWGSITGKVSFKNIVIRIYDANLIVPTMRYAMLRNIGNGWEIDDKNMIDPVTGFRYPNLGITSVVATTDQLTVNFKNLNTWSKPLVFAQLDHGGLGAGKIAQTGQSSKSSTVIKIYDAAGVKVDPTTANAGAPLYINLLIISL